MKIYISGKITNLSEKEYTENFKSAYSELFELKYVDYSGNIVNPLDIKPLFGIKKWLFFMISDLIALKKCDAIALQINWEESKGAFIEHFVAKFIYRLSVIKLKK